MPGPRGVLLLFSTGTTPNGVFVSQGKSPLNPGWCAKELLPVITLAAASFPLSRWGHTRHGPWQPGSLGLLLQGRRLASGPNPLR
jgi:hypothetical protein